MVTAADPSGSNAGGIEFRVNQTTALNQYNPAVAALKDGGFVIVWETEARQGKQTEIYARRYNDKGKPWKPDPGEFVVNSRSAERQQSPSVAGLSDGGFVVVWHSYVPSHPATTGIYGRIYGPDGNPTSPQFVISATPGSDMYKSFPRVTGLVHGGFVVAWLMRDGNGTGRGMFAQRYNARGNKAGGEFPVNTSSGPQYYYYIPTPTALPNGSFIITWTSVFSDDPPVLVGCSDEGRNIFYGQLYSGTARLRGDRFRINSVTDGGGAISAFGTGGFFALWDATQQNIDRGIYARAFDSLGRPLDDEFRVSTQANRLVAAPAVAAFDSGEAIGVWMYGNDGSGVGIYGQRFLIPGVP